MGATETAAAPATVVFLRGRKRRCRLIPLIDQTDDNLDHRVHLVGVAFGDHQSKRYERSIQDAFRPVRAVEDAGRPDRDDGVEIIIQNFFLGKTSGPALRGNQKFFDNHGGIQFSARNNLAKVVRYILFRAVKQRSNRFLVGPDGLVCRAQRMSSSFGARPRSVV